MGKEYTIAQRNSSYKWKHKTPENKARANEHSRNCMRRKYDWDRITRVFFNILIEEN